MHQYICYHNMLKHGGNANASLRTIHSELPISIFKKTYGQLYVLEITFLWYLILYTDIFTFSF